jgi:hypothetical protein
MCNRSQLIGAEQAGAQSWTTSSECPGGTFPAKRLHAYWSGGSNDTVATEIGFRFLHFGYSARTAAGKALY